MATEMRLEGPERPIIKPEQDRLERASFVGKITDALVSRDTGRARGVVLGVTGPWGSGKSSVLNLIAADVKCRYPDAIVVRFDPWLVSGHQDLISAFLTEVIAAINAEPERAKTARKVVQTLSKYSDALAPALNLAAPWLGAAFKGGANWLASKVTRDGSPGGLRKLLMTELAELDCPIVALIDELDRVEDGEVRAVAQLVRSVADFEGVSYVLAYDPDRVAEALGGPNDLKRGRAYLEKIVQLPIALPISLPGELRALLDAEVEHVVKSLGHGLSPKNDERYSLVAEAACPALVTTPRDVKRLVGTFHPLAAMVEGEVDLADVLAYAALMVKAPLTMARIRADPEHYVDDPLSFAENARRMDRRVGQAGPDSYVEPEEQAALPLVQRLFPIASGQVGTASEHRDALSRRRGLMTMLRLGLLPGEASRDEAQTLLSSTRAETYSRLTQALDQDTLGALVDRIEGLLFEEVDANDLSFWHGAADFFNTPALAEDDRFGRVYNAAMDLAQSLVAAVARRPEHHRKAARIFGELSRYDLVLTPRWLHSHILVHGLFETADPDGDGGPRFMDAVETQRHALNLSQQWRELHLAGKLVPALSTPFPLFVLVHTKIWDPACKAALANALPVLAPWLAAVLFRPNASTEPEVIEALCGYDAFRAHIAGRVDDPEITAYQRAVIKRIL